MYLNTKFLFDNGESDYRAIIGLSITDGKLNGPGKDVTVSGDRTTVIIGTFKDGILNGIGAKIENDICVESGLYKDGVLIGAEAFKLGAKKTVVRSAEKYGYKYVKCDLYYHDGEEGNINGYTLLVCDKMVRHFISGNEIVQGERSCLVFAEYKDNEPIKLIAFENFEKGKGVTHDYYINYPFDETLPFWNKEFARRFFEWKTVNVDMGTESLPKGFINAQENVILHLPHSIKKLDDAVVSSKQDYYLEVFYEGTKEEWEQIEKGRYEYGVTEDFYGYYYHNSERYVPRRDYFDWAKKAVFIVIHCLDGDIFTHDRSY